MSTPTAGDGSNDFHSSMSPALTHDSRQDVTIQENRSTDNSSIPKTVSSKSKDLISAEWPANADNEVIYVDLRAPSTERDRSAEGTETTHKKGTNGTYKHFLNNLDDSSNKAESVKLMQSMTCGEDVRSASTNSVPVVPQGDSCSKNSEKMGLREVHPQSDPQINGKQELAESVSTEPALCVDVTKESNSVALEENLPTLTDLSTKRRTLETLADKIVNKIHNLQSMVATRHVRQQLMVLVEHHHKVLNLMSKQTGSTSSSSLHPSSLLDLNSLNSLSTSALVDLVQRMQSHVTNSKNDNQLRNRNSRTVAMTRSEKAGVQLAAGVMSRKLGELHADLDSDATASSSGGETDDDDVEYSRESSPKSGEETDANKLRNSSCWRWCRDRSLVISRWTWLQAQVSDLEYKIRQHGLLHTNLRKSRPTLLSSTPQSSKTTEEQSLRAARCFPISSLMTLPRHRTVRLSNAPSIGSKARKPVMVRCQCVQAIRRCAICAGHHNYFKPRDIHSMSENERIGQVDRGFHPVLSFPRDVDPQVELEAVVNSVQNKHTSISTKKLLKKNKQLREVSNKKALERAKIKARKKLKLKKKKLKQKKSESLDEGTDIENLKSQDSQVPVKKRKYTKRTKAAMKSRSNSFPPWSGVEDSPVEEIALSSSIPVGDVNKSNVKRNAPSYDIDDIVIPYHIAASTRVEKLQYKEIDTPRWRELLVNGSTVHDQLRQSTSVPSTPMTPGSCLTPDTPLEELLSLVPAVENTTAEPDGEEAQPQPQSVTSARSSSNSLIDLEIVEDLSDLKYIERHDKLEEMEKKRYMNFVTTGSTRRHRTHSTAASLPPNTTARTPCTDSNVVADTLTAGESMPHNHRPLSQTNSIPLSMSQDSYQLKDELTVTPAALCRKRSNSFAVARVKRDMSVDTAEPVQPWPSRSFPLTGNDEMALDSTWQNPQLVSEPTHTSSSCSRWKVVPTTTSTTEEVPTSERGERGSLVLKLSKA